MKSFKEQIFNEKGQTLLAVVFLLMLALGIVVSVSEKFYKTLKIFSSGDSSVKATGAAEALAERLLALDNSVLETYITNCGTNCALSITDPRGIVSSATAVITTLGNLSSYSVSVTRTDGAEVNMTNYPNNRNFWVCWNSVNSGATAPSLYAIFVSGAAGSYGTDTYAYNSANSSNTFNGFSAAAPLYSYQSCFRVDGRTAPKLIRFKSYYSDVTVTVVPDTGLTIPQQGVQIDITGVSGDAKKSLTLTKSPVALPQDFNYALFQKSTSEPLSN